jgi:hypothetical protein
MDCALERSFAACFPLAEEAVGFVSHLQGFATVGVGLESLGVILNGSAGARRSSLDDSGVARRISNYRMHAPTHARTHLPTRAHTYPRAHARTHARTPARTPLNQSPTPHPL